MVDSTPDFYVFTRSPAIADRPHDAL